MLGHLVRLQKHETLNLMVEMADKEIQSERHEAENAESLNKVESFDTVHNDEAVGGITVKPCLIAGNKKQ